MVRRITALAIALIIIFAMCGFAQEETGVTPEPVPTVEATDEPTAEPTVEPAAEPTAESTVEPSSEPTAEPTPEPTVEPTVEPTEEPDQETPAPTVDISAEAWFMGETGAPVWGDLNDIIRMAAPGDIIYILADVPVIALDVIPEDAAQFVFMPDVEKYGEEKYRCAMSETAPKGCVPPEDAETFIYIWVEEIPEETPAPTLKPTPTPVPEMEIRVDAQDYNPGVWSGKEVKFTLSGIPENADRFTYAVIAYDERFIILSGNTYTCADEGESDLRFVILDGIGDVAARSNRYTPMLDRTAPHGIYVEMKEGSYKKYFVTADDALSGVAAYSNDGGVTWKEPDENGAAAFKGNSGDVVPAGMIMAMDNAGNIAAYEADFYLPEKMPTWGGGGGGGGDGGDDTAPHAPPADETDLNPYNALELEISEEPMSTLTIGETELPLDIKLDFAGDYEIPEDHEALFTARLEKWGGEENPEEEEKPDTLVISAVHDENITGEYAYMFHFNGVVYRMLMNSGIDYLVFETRDGICAISNAGFTAGTEYTRMKAEGVSTKYMDYTVRLAGDGDMETPVEMAMEMEITLPGSEEIYPLVDEVTCGDGTMYYYDVQVGSIEMMEVPFGAWILDGTAMDDMAVVPE